MAIKLLRYFLYCFFGSIFSVASMVFIFFSFSFLNSKSASLF
uniref:Uncharacterized protein n=1 Tax=Rhizophora mucronata TaxID=61149 RepID=A0A2P2ING3_RHIMU